MRRIIAFSIFVAAVVVGVRMSGLPWWALGPGLLGAGVAAWRLSICPHSGPLALLPATTALDGTPLPARWHCDVCGQTWTANFAKEQTPVRKFTGYDESKAISAAKRAAELVDRQRALALQRAGLTPAAGAVDVRTAGARRKATRRVDVSADSAAVVPIGQGRRFAG